MIAYHPQASTTYKTRKAIKENIDNLTMQQQADKYDIALHTVSRWRNREDFNDKKHGAIKSSKSISDLEEYIICEIRKTTLLPLDDLLDVIKGLDITITRSSLARALRRNDLSNLKKYIKSLNEEDKLSYSKFKEYKAGYIHIDIKYLPKINSKRTYLYVAIDRSTRIVFADIYEDKTAKSAESFLSKVINHFPFEIYKILTDNGKEFTDRFNNKRKKPTGNHIFDITCLNNSIEHRLTAPYTPKTNGMVERVNKKVVDNVLDRITFKSIDEMKQSIFHYFYSYNYHIKHSSIGRLTPMEALNKVYEDRKSNLVCFKDNLDIIHTENKKFMFFDRVGCNI